MPQKFEQIIEILKELRVLIDSPQTDISWTEYTTVAEVLNEIDSLTKRAKHHDQGVISDLTLLLAPTGRFQEISISSGWGVRFIELSNRFDELTHIR